MNIERFRAGLPGSWLIADKTGTGDHGTTNDVGVAWTPRGSALSIAVLSSRPGRSAAADEPLVAAAARVVADRLAPGE